MSQSSISPGAYSDLIKILAEMDDFVFSRNPVLALALILTLEKRQKSGHMGLWSQSSISPGAYSDNLSWSPLSTISPPVAIQY